MPDMATSQTCLWYGPWTNVTEGSRLWPLSIDPYPLAKYQDISRVPSTHCLSLFKRFQKNLPTATSRVVVWESSISILSGENFHFEEEIAYLSSGLKSPATSWSSLIFCLELWFRWYRQLPPHVQEAGKKWCDDLVLVRVAVGWQLGWLSGQKSDHNELGYDILIGEMVFIQYYPWAISWAERSYWFWSLYRIPWMIAQAWVFLHHAWDSLLSSYQNGAATDYQYMPQRTNPDVSFGNPNPMLSQRFLLAFLYFVFRNRWPHVKSKG